MNFKSFIHASDSKFIQNVDNTCNFLNNYKKILFLCTSNRWSEHKDDIPKSTQLAHYIASKLINKPTILNIPDLNIHHCEGNVSAKNGNCCGTKDALLKDNEKNPSGYHRCWASINNSDDELWKVSKELIPSDVVIFFGSVRWGQMNAYYQTLIERLTWLENRHESLDEENIIKRIKAGIIIIGQNWNGANVVQTQKAVLEWYGFTVPDQLSWNWQYTQDPNLETLESYKNAAVEFKQMIKK